MAAAVRHPDVDLRVGIHIAAAQGENGSVIVMGLKNAIEDALELHRHGLNFHAQLLEIVLDEGGHLAALGVGGTGEDGEFDGSAGSIEQRAFRVPGEAGVVQKLFGMLNRTGRLRQRRIQPKSVGRGG